MKKFVSLTMILALLLAFGSFSASAAEIKTDVPQQEAQVEVDDTSIARVDQNSVKVNSNRQIVYTLATPYQNVPNVFIYDNYTAVYDASYSVQGTTAYVVPSGTHTITIRYGSSVLAQCVIY
jgi:hypothetical protein